MSFITLQNKETIEVAPEHLDYLRQFAWDRNNGGEIVTTITAPNGRKRQLSLEFVVQRDLKPLSKDELVEQQAGEFEAWLVKPQSAPVLEAARLMYEGYLSVLATTLNNSLNIGVEQATLLALVATGLFNEDLYGYVASGEMAESLQQQAEEAALDVDAVQAHHKSKLN